MLRSLGRTYWLAGLLALAATGTAHAQSASCTGVPAWTASTIYNPGDRLVYQDRLYEAKIQIWNAPPTHCTTCGWYQDLGACGTGGNQPPSVTLTAPADGATAATGSTVTVSANASDSDGSIAQVEFFRGTASLGVDTSPPYSVSWTNATAGSHAFRAVATDNAGATAQSATATITVGTPSDTVPPSVPTGLNSPAKTASSVSLAWNASTDNAGGSGVAGYDIYRNGSLAGSSTGTSFTSSGLTANTAYSFAVRARDNAGNASAQSAAISVTTAAASDTIAPSVPTGLAVVGQTASSISLAWAASTDNAGGSGVAGYDVYRNGTLAGSPSGNSYTATGLAAATSYSFTVRARDNAGNTSAQSAAITGSTTSGGGGGNKRLLGYFVQWGIYARNYRVKNIDTSGTAAKLTHINYAFGNVRNNRCEVGLTVPSNEATGAGGDAFADYTKAFGAAESVSGAADTWDQPLRGNWNQLKQLKTKYPGLKVLISLGGWTWSRGFSEAARPANRQAFVASCIDAYIRGNLPVTDGAGGPGAALGVFDGIDIDWEYPNACGLSCGTPEDRANFTALLAEFRSQLNAVRPGLLLTVAVGAGVDKIAATDPGQYAQHLDFINIMSYDFHGAWEPRTNHHSALFDSPNDPSTGDVRFYNTNDAVEAFLQRGVPAAKLNLGIGFYGRGWTNVPGANNGLYQTGSAAPGTYESGIEDYKVLKNLGWPSFIDANARAHWIYNGSTFWSFDNPAIITEKMSYTKAQGLGGAFFWELSGDDAQGTLAKAMSAGLE
ncbi:glycosyl hydrolase family 18 protein [Pseudoxanthomonas putridarboris]|uniref:chitinase n=1 Tax=Pseudoxanthomonas putridarboris TaxID=752605 RepID=A0ABU9J460_9GAMM